ncbi:MAG: hypothetical protein U0T81_12350 [Saprospiraceae bacterium]
MEESNRREVCKGRDIGEVVDRHYFQVGIIDQLTKVRRPNPSKPLMAMRFFISIEEFSTNY